MNEENHISFKYQGDDFLVAAEDGLRLIIVWNPWWASISIDNQALPYLKEIINAVNMNSLVTTVYALDEDEKTLGIHSKCHMLFAPEEGEPEKSFTDLLDSFFTTHNTIKENLKQLGNGMPDMEKKERVRIKGFAAYKDNSTELKGE